MARQRLARIGSLDFEVRDTFVPESRAVGYLITKNPDRPLYQFPQFALLALGIAAVALGAARGAIDDLVALASTKVRAGSTASLGGARARADGRGHSRSNAAFGARVLLRSDRRCVAESATWRTHSVEERRDIRLATTHAVRRRCAWSMQCTRWPAAVPSTTQPICSDVFATYTSPRSTSWWRRPRSKRSAVCCSEFRRIRRCCSPESVVASASRIPIYSAPTATEEDLRRWPNDPQPLEN